MITVKNFEVLSHLVNPPQEGEYALCTDTQQVFLFKESQWERIEKPDAKINVDLYELNKTLYKSMPEITFNELQKKKKEIVAWLDKTDNSYYMLLNRELADYTVFHYNKSAWLAPMEHDIVDVVCSRGKIKSVEIEDSAIEFWVEDNKDTVYMYAFFPYDVGVIECRK